MMSASGLQGPRYLVRFDDICPTMNWTVWDRIEDKLTDLGVRPLVGIVPDNQDRELEVSDPNPQYWSRVREWQDKGWTIGLHGYQHVRRTEKAGLVGINDWSEFAGLPYAEQREQVVRGISILERQNVHPTMWVAPGHSFDRVTVSVLKRVGIDGISDGLFGLPHRRYDMLWFPQQLWRFRRLPVGVWTVCVHFNAWGEGRVTEFEEKLEKFRPCISGFDVEGEKWRNRTPGISDEAMSVVGRGLIRGRKWLSRWYPGETE